MAIRPAWKQHETTLPSFFCARKFKGVFKSDNVTINWKVSYCKPCEILKVPSSQEHVGSDGVGVNEFV